MPKPIDALSLLTSQHDEVDALFERIEGAKNPSTKEALFAELADKLAAHAKIEETQFYPAVMSDQTEDLLRESAEEHLAIKRVLADLLELDGDDDSFDAKISVVKEEVTHHAREEEEGKLFPMVRKMLSADELAAMGAEMLRQFEELLQTEPRRDVPSETAEAVKL